MLMLGNQEYNDLLNRPFSDAHDTVHRIINNWNEVVGMSDTVYIIGGIGDVEYLRQLNGNLKVVFNMHDLKDIHFEGAKKKLIEKLNQENIEVINIDDISIDDFNVCTTFSDMVTDDVINIISTAATFKFAKNIINVAIDNNYLKPFCIEDELLKIADYLHNDRYRALNINRIFYDMVKIIEGESETNKTTDWWDM